MALLFRAFEQSEALGFYRLTSILVSPYLALNNLIGYNRVHVHAFRGGSDDQTPRVRLGGAGAELLKYFC